MNNVKMVASEFNGHAFVSFAAGDRDMYPFSFGKSKAGLIAGAVAVLGRDVVVKALRSLADNKLSKLPKSEHMYVSEYKGNTLLAFNTPGAKGFGFSFGRGKAAKMVQVMDDSGEDTVMNMIDELAGVDASPTAKVKTKPKTAPVVETPKRKPGRPAKLVETPVVAKRKPGRPAKIETPVKRGPGRPRKVTLETPTRV